MAFFAVIREGLETVVFLLAVFQNADEPATAGIGALLGIACAIAIGFAVYSGGVRINLARFFRITGVVLCWWPPAWWRARCTARTRPGG